MLFKLALLSFYIFTLPHTVFCLKVATINLWNVMFNWEVRKYGIAELIKENKPDVIAFQEVRFDTDSLRDQIMDLKALLSDYKWMMSRPANNITKPKLSMTTGWEKEGIGILSRKKIISSTVLPIPYIYGPDTNRRIALRVKVEGDKSIPLELIVVHFSYDRKQQCRNAKAILDFILSRRMTRVIILGDFNTYNDFEWPVQLFTSPGDEIHTDGCYQQQQQLGKYRKAYIDAWEKTKESGDKGYTFSNMPNPGYESRPDRILVSADSYTPVSSRLFGNGEQYRSKYNHSIIYHRTKTVIYNSYLSYKGINGYSCHQDCGPKGSCRCGICIRGGNQNDCLLPDCVECNSDTFTNIVFYFFILILILIHLFYGILSILLTGSNFKGDAVFSILGCNCCLCNQKLFAPQNFNLRRYKFLKYCRMWPLFRLPPYFLLALSLLLVIFIYWLINNVVFVDTFKMINSVMDEEFYISDHLMLIVELNMNDYFLVICGV